MRVLVYLLALCGLAAGAARAQGGVAKHAYPVTARLRFDAEHRNDRCRVRDEENCDIAFGESLKSAYESVVRRMFQAPAAGAPADLDITVSPVVAEVIEGLGVREVVLEARVIIRSATTGELDRLSYSARSPVLEAGLRMRAGNAMELRAGGGVHALWGTAEVHTSAQTEPTSSFSTVTPTVFGAAQYVFWPTGSRFRIRVGVELRGYLSTNVDVGFQEFSRKLSVADTYLGVYLGFETPLGSTPVRGSGPAK